MERYGYRTAGERRFLLFRGMSANLSDPGKNPNPAATRLPEGGPFVFGFKQKETGMWHFCGKAASRVIAPLLHMTAPSSDKIVLAEPYGSLGVHDSVLSPALRAAGIELHKTDSIQELKALQSIVDEALPDNPAALARQPALTASLIVDAVLSAQDRVVEELKSAAVQLMDDVQTAQQEDRSAFPPDLGGAAVSEEMMAMEEASHAYWSRFHAERGEWKNVMEMPHERDYALGVRYDESTKAPAFGLLFKRRDNDSVALEAIAAADSPDALIESVRGLSAHLSHLSPSANVEQRQTVVPPVSSRQSAAAATFGEVSDDDVSESAAPSQVTRESMRNIMGAGPADVRGFEAGVE